MVEAKRQSKNRRYDLGGQGRSLLVVLSLALSPCAVAAGPIDAAVRAQRAGDNVTAAKIFYQVVTSSSGVS